MKTRSLILVIMSLIGTAEECTTWAAPTIATFPRWKEILLDASQRDADLVFARLDDDVYQSTPELAGGLQITSSDGQLVPFLLRVASEKQVRSQRQTWLPTEISVQPPQQHAIEFLLASAPGYRRIDGIQIETSFTDFYHLVTILGRKDKGEWRELVAAYPIYDMSQFYHFRRVDIPIPENDCNGFRVIIHDPIAEQTSSHTQVTEVLSTTGLGTISSTHTVNRRPFQVQQFRYWGEVAGEPVLASILRAHAIRQFRAVPQPPGKPSRFEFESWGQPLTSITLVTDDTNFARDVQLEVASPESSNADPSGERKWQLVAQDQIRSIAFRELREAHLTIRFPENRGTQWRITIEDGDSPPLHICGVEGEGLVHEVVYLHDGGRSERLYFGARNLPAAKLDHSALKMILGQGYGGSQVQLGAFQVNSAFHSGPAPVAPAESLNVIPWILGFVLLAATVLGLGSALLRVEQNPPKVE